MHTATNIFFDLDGTLTDPKEGIVNSIVFALEQVGHAIPTQKDLNNLIGPPLRDYFERELDEEKAKTAMKNFVQHYDFEGKCLTENALYPEIPSVLNLLRQHGKRLFVVTAKPKTIAEKIVRHFGLDSYFLCVYGAEQDETRSDKVKLISYVLGREQIAPQSAVMIGDRKHDILGALANGVASIGALWGYGEPGELKAAGAQRLAKTPQDIVRFLLEPAVRSVGHGCRISKPSTMC